ncbi:MAG: hypothetical protein GY816_07325, partial [Cytophagales bacterium]|nr:hypothetical protein [Cytophagales bacterium]
MQSLSKGVSHLDLRVEAVQSKGVSHLDLRVEAVHHNLDQIWQYFSYSHEILIGVRLKTSRRSSVIQNKFSLSISYDTSFLNRNQVVVDGDVESNPGPVSSVESYRAGIGKCSRKTPFKNMTPNHEKWIEMTLLFCSFAVLYALIINIMIFYFIHFMAFTIVIVIYGYSYWIIWHGSFLFS